MFNCVKEPNALLVAPTLLSAWISRCDESLINMVIKDLQALKYPIEIIDGQFSYWDVTEYLDNPNTACSFDEKVKAIYAFSPRNHLELDGMQISGEIVFLSNLILSKRPISDEVRDYLVDCGYKWSQGVDCIIKP